MGQRNNGRLANSEQVDPTNAITHTNAIPSTIYEGIIDESWRKRSY